MSPARFTPAAYDCDSWDRIVAPFRDLGLPQCWAYGAASAETRGWRVERGTVESAEGIIGAAQVMVRPLPVVGGGLAWIGRGPLWRRDTAEGDGARWLTAILAALRDHYVTARGLYLRIAPPVAAGTDGCAAFAAAGFRSTGCGGWASAMVDLTRDTGALRAGLDQKWRSALNKAERMGIAVARADGDGPLDGFLAEYREFLAARGFETSVTPALLAALQRHLPAGRKLVCYRASHVGVSLGSVLIARYGRTAEYLAGTTQPAARGFNVGQLLLWRALCDSREDGLERFDVGGMDPLLTPKGIFNFKNGMGGTAYRYADEIEAGEGIRARLVRWRVARARAVTTAGAGA